jgi:hypothetical protein
MCPLAGIESAIVAPLSGTAQYSITQSRLRRRYLVVSTTRPSIDDVNTFAPLARITNAVVPVGAVTRSTTRLTPLPSVSRINVAPGLSSGRRVTFRPVK